MRDRMDKGIKLTLAGLALGALTACSTATTRPQVQDLNAGNARITSDTYTVQRGDTLYGISWQSGQDFRDVARMNGLNPPYTLQPGQTLRLDPNTQLPARAAGASGTSVSSGGGVVATPMGGGSDGSIAGGSELPDWLAPDESAMAQQQQRTRQAQSLTTGSGGVSSAATGAAAAAGLGPVYQEGSEEALAETARNAANDSVEQVSSGAAQASSSASQTASQAAASAAAAQAEARKAAKEKAEQAAAAAAAEREKAAASVKNEAAKVEKGTNVAGETVKAAPAKKTYVPVKNVDWQWPTQGEIIGKFGESESVTGGIDIAGQKGQPVKAAGPGIVVYAGSGVRGYGNLIILKHNDRYLSAYAHNDTLRVSENDVIDAGQVIATLGATDAERAQLHFEIREDGQPKDPLKFLPKR
ncbi:MULTISPECIES: peptidoglycan DD-metalloendopeptidase family protein [unclassified Cobetia]|uniref:peptidoglycan DD-metalloendopeptidase family protein n=1 Tax=unclassified Cobetia TaxID=2609414 RepID=UPI002098307D|nr:MULTISPECIES: peptidoglycan DD-metalloendopeptidase family protein [unclassified Cobetia]MCO7231273.1 peptidoglycan DD-metalloendopeptidase family protein [Cobetia sp. Dlab-2-AX]MCO7234318.1 peptidoglycan DD-metalloendopeptidase family protein [Cobetia sp. Dlab-2-U]